MAREAINHYITAAPGVAVCALPALVTQGEDPAPPWPPPWATPRFTSRWGKSPTCPALTTVSGPGPGRAEQGKRCFKRGAHKRQAVREAARGLRAGGRGLGARAGFPGPQPPPRLPACGGPPSGPLSSSCSGSRVCPTPSQHPAPHSARSIPAWPAPGPACPPITEQDPPAPLWSQLAVPGVTLPPARVSGCWRARGTGLLSRVAGVSTGEQACGGTASHGGPPTKWPSPGCERLPLPLLICLCSDTRAPAGVTHQGNGAADGPSPRPHPAPSWPQPHTPGHHSVAAAWAPRTPVSLSPPAGAEASLLHPVQLPCLQEGSPHLAPEVLLGLAFSWLPGRSPWAPALLADWSLSPCTSPGSAKGPQPPHTKPLGATARAGGRGPKMEQSWRWSHTPAWWGSRIPGCVGPAGVQTPQEACKLLPGSAVIIGT